MKKKLGNQEWIDKGTDIIVVGSGIIVIILLILDSIFDFGWV